MMQRLVYFAIFFIFSLSLFNCAKRGTPTGGLRDTIPPVIVKNNPENYSTNFTEDEIKINFDEYIRLKDINTELIISPPLKYSPEITPLTTGKFVRIKIKDTLKENTTYSFNFGKSIVDNNEENSFDYFKYVFSTGNYIDSLKLNGTVKDALLLNPEGITTLMLYEVTENLNDSIIFSEKPTYITTTKKDTQDFELTNLKEGTYMLIALKDKTNDYVFQPQYDKIGFIEEFITIPSDSSYQLTIFKETPNYIIEKPKHESENHIIFGYTGMANDLEIELISDVPTDFKSHIYKDQKKDSLHYWFKPAIENDSLIFIAKNNYFSDTLVTRMRDLYVDSLDIKAINGGTITPLDTLHFSSNMPITSFDNEKITIINQDSVSIPHKVIINRKNNIASLDFEKNNSETYRVKLLPGAITDFFDHTNDTIQVTVRTKELSDYGTLNLILKEPKSLPILVQLISIKNKVIQEKYITFNEEVLFEYIVPGDYFVRIIYDENKNKIWDPGNYLDKKQPETVIYYPKKLEIRANWSLVETFILE